MNPYESTGVLPSILSAVDAPGQVFRNLLRGNPAAAGRKLIDLLGDIADAPVPGNWIQHISKPEDEISGGELVGMTEPGIAKTLADIGIGIATDPLSFISFGAPEVAAQGAKQALKLGIPLTGISKDVATFGRNVDPLSLGLEAAGNGLNAGAGVVDKLIAGRKAASTDLGATPATDFLARANQGIKSTLGWETVNPELEAIIKQSQSIGNTGAKAGTAEVENIYKGLTDPERVAIGDAMDRVLHQGGKAIPQAGSTEDTLRILAQNDPSLRLPEMLQAVQGQRLLNTRQTGDLLDTGYLTGSPLPQAEDYLHRQPRFPQQLTPEMEQVAGSLADAGKSRVLDTPEQLADFINKNPDVGFERNAMRRSMDRAAQQGQMLTKGALGRGLVEKFPTTEPWVSAQDSSALANRVIESIGKADPDTAQRLHAAFNGMPKRDGVSAVLASANRVMKPAMVYGLVIPKVGSIVRNRIGMAWQVLSSDIPAAEKAKVAGLAFNDLARSADDAWSKVLGKRFLRPDELSQSMDELDTAIKSSRGSVADARAAIKNPRLLSALDNGVLDGFVSSEELLKNIGKSPTGAKWKDIMDLPGNWFQGVEQRGRLGLYLSLLNKSYAPEAAAKVVRDSFLDYTVTSKGNRTLRDWIPFAQFTAQSIPQQAKFLSRNPAVAAGLAPLYASSEDQPVYPYLQSQAHIGAGLDERGNPQFITGLGLPVEALGNIPDFSADMLTAGRSISKNLVGQSQPLAKTAFSAITGQDPYFQTPFTSYAKDPITGEQSDFGRTYRFLQGTGLLEPIGGAVLRQAESLADTRQSPGIKALDQLTGLRIQSVDPDQATRQILDQALKNRPDVARYTSYYVPGGADPEVQAIMDRMHEAKQRLKSKREEEKRAASSAL